MSDAGSFEYDVALSFAGEQRSHVERVAALLQKASVSVFYDSFEKHNLWGKNLYDHLSDVYLRKAKFCIIFASKEYAEKTWTNHERQSAQARALMEKGSEYILPVRFDGTEIPGILPTTGYLDFWHEGPEGIANTFLVKLGKAPVRPTQSPTVDKLACDISPRALIRTLDGDFAIPLVESCSWGDDITLSTAESANDPLFARFRDYQRDVVIAYQFDVAIAKPRSATRRVAFGKTSWNLTLSSQRTDFSNPMEIATGTKSAEDFAEMRVRRLLLNEGLPRDDEHLSLLEQINNATQESLLRGSIRLSRSRSRRFLPFTPTYVQTPALFSRSLGSWLQRIYV